MKFTVQKEIFIHELLQALRFTSSSLSSLPSLSGIYISQSGNRITIKSSNLNDFYTSSFTVDGEGTFTTIFDGKKTLEFLNVISSSSITVSFSQTGLLIETGDTQGEFSIYKTEDYPEFPTLPKGEKIILSQKLVEELHLILFSSSKDDARPVLTGILFEFDEDTIKLVSTDGFRLSLLSNTITKIKNKMSFIASSRFLQELLGFYKGGDLILLYSPNEKLFGCQMDSISIVSRVIEGDFPPYQKVIPQKGTTTITVDTQECIKQIRAVSIFTRDEGNIIICDISKKELIFKPKGQKGAQSFAKTELISYDGEDIKIAFNHRYLLDFLSIIKSEQIVIEFSNPTSPVLLKDVSRDNFIHIIMPLRTEETEN